MTSEQQQFMEEAIRLSLEGMLSGEGGPFGAVVVKDGKIIGRGNNKVILKNDPTAHAEVTAIREACEYLGSFQLEGCDIYTSCEPCPMCLGAIYWARPDRVFYANTKKDAARIGFDDQFIYEELDLDLDARSIPMIHMDLPQAGEAFQAWEKKEDKTEY